MPIGSRCVAVVGNRNLARPDDPRAISLDDDRRAFVDAEAEQFGMRRDHGLHVFLPVAGDDVLVDRAIAQQGKPFFMPLGHHDQVALGRAPHHVAALDGGAGGAAADNTPARQHAADFRQGAGAEIRIRKPPLASAVDPDGVGLRQRLDEGGAIGHRAIASVHDGDMPGSGSDEKGLRDVIVAPILAGFGRRDNDKVGVHAASEPDEFLHRLTAQTSAAMNQERAFGRADLWLCEGGGGNGEQQEEEVAHNWGGDVVRSTTN